MVQATLTDAEIAAICAPLGVAGGYRAAGAGAESTDGRWAEVVKGGVMAGKCEHGLTTRECIVCASPKYGAMSAQATATSLALPFPMRDGYIAQIIVPRDMTRAEAQRLCAFVQSLAAP